MKSVFMKRVYKRVYKVNIHRSLSSEYYSTVMQFTNEYFIDDNDIFVDNIKIHETDIFKNEFNRGDKVCIDGEILTINETIIDISQKDSYIYLVDECEILNDQESYNKAEEYIKNKERENKEEKEKKKEEELKRKLIEENKRNWFANLAEELKNQQ